MFLSSYTTTRCAKAHLPAAGAHKAHDIGVLQRMQLGHMLLELPLGLQADGLLPRQLDGDLLFMPDA